MDTQKIIPHLWYDKEAKEAAAFYASIFPQSKVLHSARLKGTPSGEVDIVSFELWGIRFEAISAGPLFAFNQSISFMVNFDPLFFGKDASAGQAAQRALDDAWARLSEGGKALMPLGKYPFSERYGWVQDRYGLSWQLILTNPQGDPRPPIMPTLMFSGANCGNAEAAMELYLSVFADGKRGGLHRYGPGMSQNPAAKVMFSDFRIGNTWIAAMDSGVKNDIPFNEAVSLLISCATQAEIDHYWGKLSAVPEAEACGWLKDRFGLSWQVTPVAMHDMLSQGSPEQLDRVTRAFLKMKKFDLAELQRAYAG